MFPLNTEIVTPDEWADGNVGPVLGIDFETYYTSAYSVRQLGNWAYCQDARFEAYLVAITDGERTCVYPPAEFPWGTIAGREWISHNREFDAAVFLRLRELGTVPSGVGARRWFCSAGLCAYLQFPRDLAGAVREVFGVRLEKKTRARMRGRRVDLDLLGLPEDVVAYAARDAEACLGLWNELSAQWPQHERRLFNLTCDMGAMGLCVDWEYVEGRERELNELVNSLAAALPWSPALSIKQFRTACETAAVAPPKSTSASDPGFMLWVEDHIDSEAATWVRHMQRIRSANRTAKVLEAMVRRRIGSGSGPAFAPATPKATAGRSPDGERMAYELKYFGASTGRWSGGGGLNLQNLNRKEAEGVDLRRAVVAPPGYRLAVVDYSQIESRVLLFLAGDIETLEMFRANPEADAYEIHARATMGYANAEPLKEYCDRTDSRLRQLAKARVLGLGFGCGWRRFIEVAKVMAGLDLSDEDAEGVVNEFRASNPKIVSLWRRLNDACASCDGGNYVLPLPCCQANPELNRHLIYRDVVAGEDPSSPADAGLRRDGRGIECTVAGERTRVYGGLLAENWTQATARDVLASAWLRCAAAGYRPVLSVHDELVFEVPKASAEEDLRRICGIMEAPMAWAPALPLGVDGKLMNFYQK